MPKVQPAASPAAGRGRGRRMASSLAEINVVPLVDVKLPVASRTDQIVGERVFVTVPLAYRQNHLVQIGDEFIRAEILQERIRQKMETATDKSVYLRGDGGVQLQDLMEVFAMLQAAGVRNVGIVNRLPQER